MRKTPAQRESRKLPCPNCGRIIAESQHRRHRGSIPCFFEKTFAEMTARGFVHAKLGPVWGMLREAGIEVIKAPIGYDPGFSNRQSKLLYGYWAPKTAIDAYLNRDQSAHTQAAWEAIVQRAHSNRIT